MMLPHNPDQQLEPSKFCDKIILADKPLDFTSADLVRLFKKQFSIKKIGHAGTLDPKATGLLILCTDSMTKRIDSFMDLEKEYSGIIKIGAVTKSFDTEKQEENIQDISHVTDKEIENVKQSFFGDTLQMPPMYSALKHKGKPLYKFARAGQEIERQPRKITISKIEAHRISPAEIFFNIVCSKGSYMRVFASDFGAKLGVGGYLLKLRRIRIGDYTLNNLSQDVKNVKFRILD
jgi:tRNA pseudouridine55 synthase